MKITLETTHGLDLLYIYKAEVSGTVVDSTIANLQADLMINEAGQWSGIHVFPQERFSGTSITFDSSEPIINFERVRCNVDIFNNEVYGIEVITPSGKISSMELIEDILERN